MNRRFYWLRLKQDFFSQVQVIRLECSEHGEKAVILYQKMMLLSLENGGVIKFIGACDDVFEEIALALHEKPEIVKSVCELLKKMGRLEVSDGNAVFPEAAECIASEGASTKRVREYRKRKALQCNNTDTKCNGSALISNGDIDIEIEKEIDIEKEKSAYALKKKREQVRFRAPTLSEVKDYCTERGNGVDAQRFIDYYTANGWKVGKNSMKDWQAAIRTWERSELAPARPQAKKPEKKEPDPFEEYRGLEPEELERLRSAGVLSDTGSADFSIAQDTGLYYLLQKAGVAI